MLQTVTFFPAIKRGNGTGHLVRSLRCAQALKRNRICETASVLIRPETESIDVEAVTSIFGDVNIVSELPTDTDVLILDRRHTDPAILESLSDDVTLVALDEDGPLHDIAELAIHMLSRRDIVVNLNVLPSLPQRRHAKPPFPIERVLVSFGGEDPAGLTGITVDALLEQGVSPSQITVLRGPSFGELTLPRDVRILPPNPRLPELLADYDLVLSSYGLTAFEALSAGCVLGIVDPSRYHARLSRIASLYRLGIRRIKKRHLRKLLEIPGNESGDPSRPAPLYSPLDSCREDCGPTRDLAAAIAERSFAATNRCPICGTAHNKSIARFSYATFYRCICSGVIYRVGMELESVRYDSDYFFQEYRSQYGKTYLDDFTGIAKLAVPRLDRIDAMTGLGTRQRATQSNDAIDEGRSSGDSPALLDVGCAYGPFLSTAKSRGYDVFGVDIAESAIDYVHDILGIPSACSDMSSFDPGIFGREKFDVVTMWYVIEHFPNLGAVLERIRGFLKPGGVFAFSTPNRAGISGRSKRRGFLEASPRDHFTILSPDITSRILSRFGFEVIEIRVTGHHPERFPLLGRIR